MTKVKDDLEAVRIIVSALDGFGAVDQERIVRWAKEKLGLVAATADTFEPTSSFHPAQPQQQVGHTQHKVKPNIKSFVDAKDPKNDMHFAATIAYFYRFEAPEDQRKLEISGEDLQEATRQTGRNRLKNPGQTLINAHSRGLLNKGSSAGTYSINTVGENLVAMTLPLGSEGKARTAGSTRKTGQRKPRPAKGATKRKESPRGKKGSRRPVKNRPNE